MASESQRPDLTPSECLVAFIDILGFGHEVERAQTKADLERAYEKIRLVQEEFQKESAVSDPVEQAEMNAEYGRRVIALSDAVVVVIRPSCTAATAMGEYDHLGFAVFELILAQARCAVGHGIFVRGGLSHGSFFFENDVLLSPALVRAHELESKYAMYPVIVVPETTRQAILGSTKKRHHASDADATPQYFAAHKERPWRDQPLYFLDYAGVIAREEHRGWLPGDHADYLDAIAKGDRQRAQAAFNRRCQKDEAFFLGLHRQRLEEAFADTDSEPVRKKYRWLMKYHNDSFDNDAEHLRDAVIDLLRFQPELSSKPIPPQ